MGLIYTWKGTAREWQEQQILQEEKERHADLVEEYENHDCHQDPDDGCAVCDEHFIDSDYFDGVTIQ